MKKIFREPKNGKLLLLAWSALCIIIFIYFSGRVSYIFSSTLADIPFLAERMQRLEIISYLGGLIPSFFGIIIFFISYTSLGALFTKPLKLDNTVYAPTVLDMFASLGTKFLIGQGIFSLIFLTLGGLYKLTPIYTATLLAIGALLGFPQLASSIRYLYREIRSNHVQYQTIGTDKVIYQLSMAILCLSLLHSTARISYDSTAIYFSDAKITAITERVQFFTNDTFVASVFQSVIQYAAIIQLFGDQSARMFSWLCGIVILVFSLALGERVGLSRQSRIILLALIMTSTAFIDLLGDGKVDLISNATVVAAIYWMVVQRQSKTSNNQWLLLIGFLIGLSIVARPFNAFLMAIFTFLFYFHQAFFKNESFSLRFKSFINPLIWISLGAMGLGIYHLLANWVILGNALGFLSSVSKINQANGPWDAAPNQLPVLRLLYPLVTAFRNTPQSLGNVSPMVIAVLPAVFIHHLRKDIKISSELSSLSIISAITLSIWIYSFFTVVEIRYVFFLWIILFLPAAELISSVLKDNDLVFKNIEVGVLLTLLSFIIFRTVFISLDSYSPLDQQGNPQCYDFVLCKYIKSINEDASPGDRVLNLSAYRYYLRTDLFACSTTHEEYDTLQALWHKNPEDFWLEVYRRGYKYIAYENDYTTRHLQFGFIPDPENTPDWITLERIDKPTINFVAAYKINVHEAPISRMKTCVQNEDKIWEIQSVNSDQ